MNAALVASTALALVAAQQASAQTPAPAPAQTTAPVSATTPTPAVSDDSGQLEDIIVTAQRREENLQRAAVSVTAISNDTLVQKGVTNITQLTQLAPALRAVPGAGGYVNYAVRGINNFSANAFADSAIVVNYNAVPLSHPTGAHGLFYDVERVEVLKGPQGTLYGRNATGGAINVISARPTSTFDGYVNAEYGNYDRKLLTGAINVPLSDTLAIRAAGQLVRRDPYFRDNTSDEIGEAVRLSARYDSHQAVTVDLIGDFAHDGGRGTGSTLIANRDVRGGPLTGLHFVGGDAWLGSLNPRPSVQSFYAPFTTRRQEVQRQDNRYYGVTGTLTVSGDLGNFVLIPAYRGTEINYLSNAPTFYVGERQDTDQYSLEARFSSSDDHALRYLIGGFYLHDTIDAAFFTENQPTTASTQSIDNVTETYAAFGQLTWAIQDTLRLTGGVRYTNERKTTDSVRRDLGFGGTTPINFATFGFTTFFDPNQGVQRFATQAAATFKKTTWKAGVEWDVAPRSLVYANVSTGFKAGGFFFGPAGSNIYRPETVTAYTAGAKNRFLDNSLQINLEAFLYKYKDQQISHFQVFPAPFGNIFVTDNAGDATIYGLEIEADYRVARDTRLRTQFQYLHGRYDSLSYFSPTSTAANGTCASPAVAGGFQIDCSGKPMLYTPRFIITGGIDQTFRLHGGSKLLLSLDSRYETARETQLNYLPETRAGAYSRSDANLTWTSPDDRYSIGAFVLNIEDKAVISSTQVGRNYTIAASGLIAAFLQDPRTYGVRLGLRF